MITINTTIYSDLTVTDLKRSQIRSKKIPRQTILDEFFLE